MSIQAVAWVLSQSAEDLPGSARLIMIALANHADHSSGYCWPSLSLIAKESGCGERTVSRYLPALQRNGFIDIRRTQRKSGQFRSNDYWILFDRKPAAWQFYSGEEENQEADPPHAKMADGQIVQEADPPHATGGGPPDATDGVAHKKLEPSDSEPSESAVVDSEPREAASPPEPAVVVDQLRVFRESDLVKGFDPNARQRERERLKAAEEARKPKAVFVHYDTRAWHAWQKTKPQGFPTTQAIIDGRSCRGWFFPTLFPPETGPPGTGDPPPAKKAG